MKECNDKPSKSTNECKPLETPIQIIVKLQKSLTTTGDKQQVLVYDEYKSVLLQLDIDDHLDSLLAGEDKAYFNAIVVNGHLRISPEQLQNINW